MDQIPLSGGESKKFIFRASALLLLVMTVFLFAHFRSERAATNVEESIVKVERKDFTQTLRLNGTTQASRSFVVLAPRLEGAQVELQRNEIVSRIDAEKNQEAVDEAQTTLKQLKETYQLKRAAAAAAIRIVEIQRDRALEAMRYSQGNAAKMVVHSPMPGVVVYNTIWLGGRMGTVQQGDQVRPGVPFLQVVDPSQMEVRVQLNQVDLLKVHPGQQAQMYLDAYPGMALPAVLEDISPLGHTGHFTEAVRSFNARFSVQGMDARHLPDLSAALDLDLGSQKNVLVVPWQSIGFEGGHSFVWLETSGGSEKRTVQAGSRNDLEAIVKSGLSEGDIIRRTAIEDRSGQSLQ